MWLLDVVVTSLLRVRDAVDPMPKLTSEASIAGESDDESDSQIASSRPLSFNDPNSRAAQILADIFPACEMAELYHTGASRAKVHSNATLLFADMVGFTAWSARQTPDRVFSALTLYYQLLDSYCDDSGGYKIETVGDCYVASFGIVKGVNGVAEVAGALDAIEMGLRIVEVSVLALRKICEDDDISMRVGIHTGQVCSGIIKSTRPRWQLFGDTINVASRMESTGMPSRIHVSAQTHAAALKANEVSPPPSSLHFSPVTTNVKGKGTLTTYYVDRGRSNVDPDAHSQGAPRPRIRRGERESREDEATTEANVRFKNSRMAERALLNGSRGARLSRGRRMTREGADSPQRNAGGARGAGGGLGSLREVNEGMPIILVATDQTEDLVPICTRLNSSSSPVMAGLRIVYLTTPAEVQRLLYESEVVVLIYRPTLLEDHALEGGRELRNLLSRAPRHKPIQIQMVQNLPSKAPQHVVDRYPRAQQVVARAEQIDVEMIASMLSTMLSPSPSPSPTPGQG